jgi:hypothetical protein
MDAQQSSRYLCVSQFRYDIEVIDFFEPSVSSECAFDLCERNSKASDILVTLDDIFVTPAFAAINSICPTDGAK